MLALRERERNNKSNQWSHNLVTCPNLSIHYCVHVCLRKERGKADFPLVIKLHTYASTFSYRFPEWFTLCTELHKSQSSKHTGKGLRSQKTFIQESGRVHQMYSHQAQRRRVCVCLCVCVICTLLVQSLYTLILFFFPLHIL